MDLAGHTVIPGLVGMHNHTFYTTRGRSVQLQFSSPRLYLGTGITTARTTGGTSPYHEINMKRGIERGEIPGRGCTSPGPYLTGPGGASTMAQVGTSEQARRIVNYWADEGVTWFKAYTDISREALASAIRAAHARGLKFTGHLCSVSFREAVRVRHRQSRARLLHQQRLRAESRAGSLPRRHARQPVEGGHGRSGGEADHQRDDQEQGRDVVDPGRVRTVVPGSAAARGPGARRAVTRSARGVLAARREFSQRATQSTMPELFRRAQAFEVAFVRAGGLLGSGVDPTGVGGALQGFGDQRNYELLIEAGFTPVEAIRIMTLNGAMILGVDKDLGSVTAGKLADLVVIKGNPIATPAEIRQTTIVFKDGVGYDSAALIAAVRGLVGIR